MSKEIKEILEALKPHNDIIKEYPLTLSIEEQKLLLDYINKLRKENKHLSNDLAEAILFNQKRCKQNKELQKENERLKTALNGYKSRCEKANEYIKENKDKYYHDWGEDDGSYDTYLDETEIDKLSSILNGGDDND